MKMQEWTKRQRKFQTEIVEKALELEEETGTTEKRKNIKKTLLDFVNVLYTEALFLSIS